MTFKGQIKVIEFLMGSMFWTVHVYETHNYIQVIMVFDLMIFDLGWPLNVKSR